MVNGAAEDGAAARMRDAHQLLHHFGGGGDFGAADRAERRLSQAVIGLLRRIGLGERGRPQLVRQVAIGQAALPRLP